MACLLCFLYSDGDKIIAQNGDKKNTKGGNGTT